MCQIKSCRQVFLGLSLMAVVATKSVVALTSTVQSDNTQYYEAESRHFLRKEAVRASRELKNQHFMINNVGRESLFDRPIEDWSGGQWIGLAVITLLATIALCCVCSIIRLVFGCLCPFLSCGGGTRRRRYYAGAYYHNSFVPPEDLRPPPYNPSYANRQSRSVPSNFDEPIFMPNNECSILDCLALLCCLQCCRRNQCSFCDVLCGLCCFEFCCRGGRDVVGNGASGYGTFE